MLSRALIQFSVEGQGCVPSLLFDLRPNFGGGNEDNGDLFQKVPCMHFYTQHPQPWCRPPPTHASTRASWTLTGKSGSVSFGVTAPFSWVLVLTSFFVCVPSKSLFPQFCISSGSSMVGLMATSSKRAYAIPRSTAPRAPAPVAVTVKPYLCRRHSDTGPSDPTETETEVCLSVSWGGTRHWLTV